MKTKVRNVECKCSISTLPNTGAHEEGSGKGWFKGVHCVDLPFMEGLVGKILWLTQKLLPVAYKPQLFFFPCILYLLFSVAKKETDLYFVNHGTRCIMNFREMKKVFFSVSD